MKLKALVVALAMAGVATTAMAAKAPVQKQEFKAIKAEMATAKLEMGFATPKSTSSAAAKSSGPTAADVGDADSFGHYAKYIGVMGGGSISLADDCTPDPSAPPGPDDHCIVLNPQPMATNATINDIARMTIPAKSSTSLFCHWQTPIAVTQWQNLTGAAIPNARIVYSPSYKFENPVLSDPTLIDPATGLPLGGSITVTLSQIRHHMTLQPGEMALERDSETRVCIGGSISKAMLQSYGLSDAQIDKFFASDTKVTMNINVQSVGVVFSSIIVGTRWMGD